MRIKINVVIGDRNQEVNVDIKEETKIDATNLNNELIKHLDKYAWWSTLYMAARSEKYNAQSDYGLIVSQIDNDICDKFDVKLTESRIRRERVMDPRYKKAITKLNDTKYKVDVLRVMLNALVQRKEILISLSHNMRDEQRLEGEK